MNKVNQNNVVMAVLVVMIVYMLTRDTPGDIKKEGYTFRTWCPWKLKMMTPKDCFK